MEIRPIDGNKLFSDMNFEIATDELFDTQHCLRMVADAETVNVKNYKVEISDIFKQIEMIEMCLTNVYNTGHTMQDCDYRLIHDKLDSIKQLVSVAKPLRFATFTCCGYTDYLGTKIPTKLVCRACGQEMPYNSETYYCPCCGSMRDGEFEYYE